MEKHTLDELLSELLIIKDLYVCGRMNQTICSAIVESGSKAKYSKPNWKKYEDLSESYRNDSVQELICRESEIIESVRDLGPVALEVVLDSTYDEFDQDLVNEMMLDFFGGTDTVAFATSYNHYAADFNAMLSEYILSPEHLYLVDDFED